MEFFYPYDHTMFNCTLALPDTNTLRFTTFKLGNFLGLKTIETLSLNQITSRFIIDLNLPSMYSFFY